ncbi:uncharacterized protein CANTADRAFT_46568 [Suhomyces tanzawaensis NRRL Y-17324]|uniref:Uncharacterized protein n=1 Tax=Suhomyces tanzawaensis NRRL Y-17324 TaxID=984487 RepID=A0A1E4SNL3_9ASCO|nr:uncharacterized protein CANTADRAFT_46568 [Suhomyces tanzawaensis NRRL Y-17324]ODV81078.1 hypothetical protein CANTADRAFT_46568 [Suhomyces tanzawaensis NRRL Y-17324]
MSNQYVYNNYQYSPSMGYASLSSMNAGANGGNNSNNTSPLFNNLNYVSPTSTSSSMMSTSNGSGSSATSSASTGGSNYSFHTPRLRYYLSKSFDIEDDMEFCPDIPEQQYSSSPNSKKFNPYTASVFSPSQEAPPSTSSPRVHTPRLKKPLEIIHPQTKLRVGSPATQK